jgi:hypothetical protein
MYFFGAAMAVWPLFTDGYAWLYQLTAIVLISGGILSSNRYVLSDYIYLLDGYNFIVVKATGKKFAHLCNLPLAEGITSMDASALNMKEITRRYGKISLRYNFCQNMFPEKPHVYIFTCGGKKSSLMFEPDLPFINELAVRMNAAKKLQGIETGDEV